MFYLEILLIIFWFLNVLDWLTTYYSLSVGNIEMNPLYYIFNDIWLFGIIKYVLGFFFCMIILRLYDYIYRDESINGFSLRIDIAFVFLYFVVVFIDLILLNASVHNFLISHLF